MSETTFIARLIGDEFKSLDYPTPGNTTPEDYPKKLHDYVVNDITIYNALKDAMLEETNLDTEPDANDLYAEAERNSKGSVNRYYYLADIAEARNLYDRNAP